MDLNPGSLKGALRSSVNNTTPAGTIAHLTARLRNR
ncbi:hypothetical protein HFN69_22055 [Rhizobium laguerreae]|nr:hypothetical protein [Rhizobium laguerreae]MBY3549262.1 hypothetical protein [Rhizobium laguerreae]